MSIPRLEFSLARWSRSRLLIAPSQIGDRESTCLVNHLSCSTYQSSEDRSATSRRSSTPGRVSSNPAIHGRASKSSENLSTIRSRPGPCPTLADFAAAQLLPGLFNATPSAAGELRPCYFEGFPPDRIFSPYAEDSGRWSASICGRHELWTAIWICMRCVMTRERVDRSILQGVTR